MVSDTSESGNSTFITSAVIRREKLILSVSTSRASPVLAKGIKQELEQQFDETIVEMIDVYARRRKKE
jgi:precorrin-2 dehydrogenase / sirohydrochlorin ferrochelatase